MKGRDTEMPFARRAESGAGRADEMALIQKLIEELPACGIPRRLEPHVRRVDAAEHFHSQRRQAFANDLRIGHVMRDDRAGLLAALRRVNAFPAALGAVADALELRCLPGVAS